MATTHIKIMTARIERACSHNHDDRTALGQKQRACQSNWTAWFRGRDSYQIFILLSRVLSFQAALTLPIIMMSRKRESQKDRLHAEHGFQIDMLTKELHTLIRRTDARET